MCDADYLPLFDWRANEQSNRKSMKRRSFLKIVGGTAGACALGVPGMIVNAVEETLVNGVPCRALGKTGVKIPIVGFPGLALNRLDQAQSDAGVKKAFDRGYNYFDTAPAYGSCEEKMGIALKDIDRSKIFLACKTKMRDKDAARQELERSLQKLKTDHFDLYQMHHLVKVADVKKALGPGGAIEAFLKAKEEGKIKYIGFSAHTTQAAVEAMNGFNFDTVMFPINFVEYYNRGYGREVIELANKKGAALIAIKPLSFGAWGQGVEKTRDWWYRCTETPREVDMAFRFSLSQPGVISGIPPSFLDLFDKMIDAGKRYKPIALEELKELQELGSKCGSIFEREEKLASSNAHGHGPIHPGSPHECECYA
jgi:predicted aldo/keto reductase-like oxidoreductase